MKRTFALPLAVALSVDSLLFLTGGKPPPPPVNQTPALPPGDPVQPMPPPEPLEPASGASAEDPGGKPAPALPEPPPVEPGPKPTVEVPISRPSSPADVMKVPPGPPGPIGDGTGWDPQAIGADRLDNPPRAKYERQPAYPYEAKASSMGGQVVVAFTVDERGRVVDPRVVSSTQSVFEEATLQAVRQWRFEPGRRNGVVVRFRMVLPVEFKLEPN